MKPIIMPKLGLTMEEGTILLWKKNEDEIVKKGEVLLEVETDKSVNEVEANVDGRLGKIVYTEGETVDVLTVIGYILESEDKEPENWDEHLKSLSSSKHETTILRPVPAENLNASPVAKKMAADLGLELYLVNGTGKGGKITKEDVLRVNESLSTKTASKPQNILASPRAKKLASEKGISLELINGSGPKGRITETDVIYHINLQETIKPSRLKQITAQRMVQSFTSTPHFYLKIEADASKLASLRTKLSSRFDINNDVHITFTDLLIVLVAQSIKRHPIVNAFWVQESIQMNHNINLGLAVAVKEGLIVPVIKKADKKTIIEIANERAVLIDKATNLKLSIDDLEGGTFTISNLGMFGIDEFSAILNPPQSAILAVGQIKDRVLADKGEMIIRPTVFLTLTIDHRILDGFLGSQFLSDLKDAIENPESYFNIENLIRNI